MSVAFGSVKEQIAHSGTRDVLVLWRHVREDDPRCDFGSRPAHRHLLEVVFTELGEAQEPEHSLGESCEYSKPIPEGGGVDL